VRKRALVVSSALAAVLAAGCAAGPPASYRATTDTCYAFAVQAIQRHITVTAEPQACAGLSHEQVNIAVARAIQELTRPRPKAIARRLAHQDRAYVARLVGSVPPPAPATQTAGPARPSAGLPLSLAALAAWVLTATAGAFLLAGWFRSRLAGRGRRHPRTRAANPATAVTVGHFGLALTGLGVWIGFVATGLGVLAWIAVALVVVIAGLGMAVLAVALPEPSRSPAATGKAGLPVPVIALHGGLATLTILLVVLAAIGVG
jgi:manganese efflux pump family protein